MANFRKQKLAAKLIRANHVYPLAHTGMVLAFRSVNLGFWKPRGGEGRSRCARRICSGHADQHAVMEAMQSVDSAPLWSVLDKTGTEVMMKQVLGQAGSVTDYESVRKRLDSSWYGMNFQHGVKFDLTISTGDTFAAATVSSLLSAASSTRR